MSDQNNHSSSSDEETTKKALEEATDQNFLSNSMFKSDKTKKKDGNKRRIDSPGSSEKIFKRSLRINPERADNFHSFGVTQSYKDYVAKKLSEILDRDIEIDEVKSEEVKNSVTDKYQDLGIKLLNSSKNFLTGDEEEEEVSSENVRKRPLKKSDRTAEILSKCKEAVVDVEKIISKLEVKSWDERQKGVVFKYKKLADGTLVEI